MTLLLHQGNLPHWSKNNESTPTTENAVSNPQLEQCPRHANEVETLCGVWNFTPWVPAVDIIESEHFITITLDAPGISNGLEISIEHGVISISGRRFDNNGLSKINSSEELQRHERPAGIFSRHFKLSSAVESSRTHANYRNGVLTISLPKAQKIATHSHRIWIPASNDGIARQN